MSDERLQAEREAIYRATDTYHWHWGSSEPSAASAEIRTALEAYERKAMALGAADEADRQPCPCVSAWNRDVHLHRVVETQQALRAALTPIPTAVEEDSA